MAISSLHTFVIRTRVLQTTLCGLAALSLLCAQARAEQAEEAREQAAQAPQESQEPQAPQEPLFSLHPIDGRLVLEPHAAGHINCGGGRYFTSVKDEAQFDNYRPRGYFSGRVCVRSEGGRLELGGWREMYRDWQVIRFTLSQTSQATVAEYTIRTPVGQPDVTVSLTEPDLTRLLLRHTEIAPMLDQVLCALADSRGDGSSADGDGGRGGRGDCWFDFDPSIEAQVEPGDWREPPGMRAAVSRLLAGLESHDWRERDRAENALGRLGREAALYLLLRLERSTLTSQQNMAVERVLRHYPLLSAADRELCRREPSRLRPIAREPGLALLGVRGEPAGGPDSPPAQDTLTARATTAPAPSAANIRAVADTGQ